MSNLQKTTDGSGGNYASTPTDAEQQTADWALKNEGPRGEAFKNVSVSGQK